MTFLQQVWHDVRFALRMLRRAPGFAVTTIVTLAIGIGLTSTVFSVFNAVLLKPLSYPNPERLVWMATRDLESPFPLEAVTSPDFLDWNEHASSFEHIFAYGLGDEPFSVDGHATRERIAMVSDGFWPITGVRLAHGRLRERTTQGARVVRIF